MPTQNQIKQMESSLREYRKKYLTNKKNLEVDESATRIMVNNFLTAVLGYQELVDIKTEYNIRGEYADYVIQLARKKHVVIEVKSIQIDLNDRHLRQSFSYAANEGIDWIMLFNGKQIALYRLIFGKPITHHNVFFYDLSDLTIIRQASHDIVNLAKKSVVKNELETYWKRFDAITPANIAKTLFTEEVIRSIRLKIKKNSGIAFTQNEVLDAVNELIIHECDGVIKPKNLK
jgi:predicted type IV restriction endonuclease